VNNWKLPWHTRETAVSEEPLSGIRVVSDSANSEENDGKSRSELNTLAGKRIEFPSSLGVEKAGIRVEAVQVRPIIRSITVNGTVDYDPARYARLTARTGGAVWRVEKEIGDFVRQGDVLALVDASDVGQVKADLMQSLTQVDLRRQTVERLESAQKRGVVSDQSLREAQASLKEARIRLNGDHQRLLNLGLPVPLDDLLKVPNDQLAKHLRLLGLPEKLRQQLNVDTLTANLLPLTAPFDGVIVQRTAAAGEIIEKTQPKIMFVLADVRHLHVDLDVNPEDMGSVKVGQKVIFAPTYALAKPEIPNWKPETKANPEMQNGKPQVSGTLRISHFQFQTPDSATVTARTSHISPEVDEKTRRVKVHAEFDNFDGRLRPNDYGIGRIVVHEEPKALVVPSEAVHSDGGDSLVFVRSSANGFVTRAVQTGLRDGNVIEVQGVQAGEQVATTGSFALLSELQKERISGGD
jgi:cobalt-zinc-cadmium efflux system membrane fusion protein